MLGKISYRFTGLVLLFGAWGGLVLLHQTSAGPFVTALTAAISSIGTFHVATSAGGTKP